jgi:peptidyl-prolyl cis-trans isomerase D
MLQSIRDKAQGWIAWAIVILISIPFALWGIQEYLGIGGEPIVAQVDGEDVPERDLERRARDFRENLRISLGAAYDPDLIDEPTLRAQVLDRMIDERVLLDGAADWGLRAGDSLVAGTIQNIPVFQRDGRFDNALYDTVLRNQGMNRPMFESGVRQDIVANQVRAAVQDSAVVTQRQLAEAARLVHQERQLSYLVIPSAPFEAEVQVSDDALDAYYQGRRDEFLVPERVSVQYLLLAVDELAAGVKVDEAALRNYYEQHAAAFRTPEQRHVRHILIALPAGADEAAEAAALAQAQAVRERLQAGEDFAAVAREASQDPGSAEAGGDLGWIEPGMMVEAFETAAFKLGANELSEPVRSQFGYHLLEVVEIRGSGAGSFEQVRDKVEAAYRRHEAENQFYDYAERLADLTYENPGSLAPAAEALGLEVRTAPAFTRQQAPAELDSPKVLTAAFSNDVLEQGNNSEIIELSNDRVAVLRVLEHQPEQLRPLAEVREQVAARYRRDQAAAAAAAAGDSALSELAPGESLASLAAARGWRLEQVDYVARDALQVPQPVLERAFALQPPVQGAMSRGAVSLGGDYALVEVSAVRDGDLAKLDEGKRAVLENRLRNAASRSDMEQLLADLRNRADVEIIAKP